MTSKVRPLIYCNNGYGGVGPNAARLFDSQQKVVYAAQNLRRYEAVGSLKKKQLAEGMSVLGFGINEPVTERELFPVAGEDEMAAGEYGNKGERFF